jgi:hypothetical protein
MVSRQLRNSALLLALLACSESSTTPAPADAYFRVYNTAKSAGDLAVRLDNVTVRSHVAFGTTTDSVPVSSGAHLVALVPSAASRSSGSAVVTFRNGLLTTLVALDSLTVLIPQPLTDTGLEVPPGKSRLRVAHLAEGAPPLNIFRIQPDYPDPVNVMFPFLYGAVSRYIPSTPGNWWVIVIDSIVGDTLIDAGPIAIPEGQERTVVIVQGDSTRLQTLILDP